jgi:FkbM family methyltransferase
MMDIKMNKISRKFFLDCGANEGQGFLQFVKMGKITSETEVHSFEPNPYCKIDEFKLKLLAKDFGITPNVKFHRTAILNQDGVCSIVVSKDINKKNGEGTAVHGIKNVNTTNNLALEGVELIVSSTNLSNFIDKLELNEHDELRIKIDIEGSEFLVLEEMLQNFKHWTCLKEIWVEWHERYMRDFNPYLSRLDIEKKFAEKNITIVEWH